MIQIGRKKNSYYNGILVKADGKLHDDICSILQKKIELGKKILDLGAGEGAMSQKLTDLGYEVVSADMNKDDFKANNQFHQINFNHKEEIDEFALSYSNYFDGVLGIEVIEHVENPWEYIRLLKKMLKPDGLILISTPNITSRLSRLNFLFKGQFIGFDKHSLSYGHINPVSFWELSTIFSYESFKNIEITHGGYLPSIWITKNIFIFFISIISHLFRPFMLNVSRGWCVIVTAEK